MPRKRTPAVKRSFPPAPIMTITGQIGDTGARIYGGVVAEEFLRELQGQTGIRTFNEMAENDPTCGAVLFAVKMLIRNTEWHVQPVDDSPAAQDAADWLEGAMNDMEMPWTTMIDQACSMFDYGFAPLEIVYKRRNGEGDDPKTTSAFDDGKLGWRKIELRKQRSLIRWELDPEGTIVGMWQQPTFSASVLIPAEKMVIFRTTEGQANPEGRSILRNAYRPWYFKKRIEEFEGIGVERDLAGLPVAFIPNQYFDPNADPIDKGIFNQWKALVTGVRRDKQEGLVLPSDRDDKGNLLFDFKLLSTGGTRAFDTTKIIDRYDRRIAMSAMADFLFLGQQSVGSWALSSDKTALFAQATGGFMAMMAETFNRGPVTRIWKLNAMDPAIMPRVKPNDLEHQSILEVSQALSQLASAGMPLFPDRDLENTLRDMGGLPPAPEDGSLDDMGAPGGGVADEPGDTTGDTTGGDTTGADATAKRRRFIAQLRKMKKRANGDARR